ncbi:MAG: FmdB family zinc ribbon protein [Thermodesulfobacteriota bacterium]
MPIYEHICDKCEDKFEQLSLSPDEKTSCSKCGTTEIEKLFSTFENKSISSTHLSSTSINSVGSGCGCTPVGCGCGVKQ